MKSVMFDSWHQWKVCFLAGCKKLVWGFMRIVSCLILGVLSLFRALWRAIVGFVQRNAEISIGCALVIVFAVWVLTFASMRARAVGAECQRDSISWEFQKFKKGHGYE